MSISPLTFTGVSTFSNDFQSILSRAVSIAQLPVQQLQNRQTNILQEKTLAGNLNSAVADLASAVAALGVVGSSGGIAATSSDSTKVEVISTNGSSAATYNISNISSIAKVASETSLKGYADSTAAPVSAAGNMQLVVGSKTYSFTLGAGKNNLAGLQDAINGLNAGVNATVLTTGTGATPNYLSLSAGSPGATTLQLLDLPSPTSTAFLSAANQGTDTTPASETSLQGYATSDSTAVSANGIMKLTLGSQSYNLAMNSGTNNLNGLRDAINNLGVGVTASVTTGGDGLNHLTLTAGSNGATTLKLDDAVSVSPAQFLTSNNQGANTVFQLNGVDVSKAATTINDVVPGVTFSVLGTTSGTDSVTLTLAPASSRISSALQDLATKYNAVATQVNAQIGSGAGLLSGNNIVLATQDAMRSLLNYQGGGTIKSLAALGIELSNTGQMSFNQTTFNKLSDSQIAASFSLLGSATAGLGALAGKFTQISDPVTGLIQMQQQQFDATDKRLTDQIATMTDRINTMQTALQAKLQQADSLLASLQSQQNMLTASIQSMNYSMYGYQQNPNGSTSMG